MFKVHDILSKYIITLVSGGILAQIITFIATPFITRVYSPEDFATLTLFIAYLALLTPFTSLRYAQILPFIKSNKLTDVAVLFLVILNVLFSIVVFLISYFISLFLIGSVFFDIYVFLSIAILGAGLYETLIYLNIRSEKFNLISQSKVIYALFGSLTKISLGNIARFQDKGLILAQSTMQLVSSFWLSKNVIWSNIFRKHKGFRRKVKIIAFYYKEYPLYQLPSEFIRVFSSKLPIFYFGLAFDKASLGQLGLAFMIVALPVSLLAQSAKQGYLGGISKVSQNELSKIQSLTIKLSIKIIGVITLPLLILALYGETIFVNLFGNEWGTAGLYSQIFSLYIFFQIIYVTFSTGLINKFSLNKLLLYIEIYRVSGIFLLFMFCYIFSYSDIMVVSLYSVFLSLFFIFSMIFILRNSIYNRES